MELTFEAGFDASYQRGDGESPSHRISFPINMEAAAVIHKYSRCPVRL